MFSALEVVVHKFTSTILLKNCTIFTKQVLSYTVLISIKNYIYILTRTITIFSLSLYGQFAIGTSIPGVMLIRAYAHRIIICLIARTYSAILLYIIRFEPTPVAE